MPAAAAGPSAAPSDAAPPNLAGASGTGAEILLPEVLGFEPQYLLDDIWNVAADAALATVNAMQEYLDAWTARQGPRSWTAAEEIEQGLVSLQTLLDTHVDDSFDFFEIWARRNVFNINADDGPLVLPHQKDLDLHVKEVREVELMAEIEELRRKKENMHRLNNIFARAVAVSDQQRQFSEERLARLSFLRDALPKHADDQDAAFAKLAALPGRLEILRAALAEMPTEEAIASARAARADDAQMRRQYGKREWEDLRGYAAWAVRRAVQADPDADAGAPKAEDDPLDAAWCERQERTGAWTTRGPTELAAAEDTAEAPRPRASAAADSAAFSMDTS